MTTHVVILRCFQCIWACLIDHTLYRGRRRFTKRTNNQSFLYDYVWTVKSDCGGLNAPQTCWVRDLRDSTSTSPPPRGTLDNLRIFLSLVRLGTNVSGLTIMFYYKMLLVCIRHQHIGTTQSPLLDPMHRNRCEMVMRNPGVPKPTSMSEGV